MLPWNVVELERETLEWFSLVSAWTRLDSQTFMVCRQHCHGRPTAELICLLHYIPHRWHICCFTVKLARADFGASVLGGIAYPFASRVPGSLVKTVFIFAGDNVSGGSSCACTAGPTEGGSEA